MIESVAPALLVDLYELTMADAYQREGIDQEPATFSLFVRALPATRGFIVAAGLDDALGWLEQLRFGPDELGAVSRLGLFDDAFLDWLAGLRFSGSVRAVAEGTIVFAGEPILEVDAPLATGQLAESYLLNQVFLQSTLATKAARLRHAAGGRPVIDFALRRCHGVDAAMKLARVAKLVGLAATSNVAGALRYDLAPSGTMAHSYIQAHASEPEAMAAFARAYGRSAVLLVDTYDSHQGIQAAVAVAADCSRRGTGIGGIRLDSGDLGSLAVEARRLLDAQGLNEVQIFASGGLDEHQIDHLVRVAEAPIDGFGVGSSLGVSADAPSLDTVYKLVAVGGKAVRKTSTDKATWPGDKQVWRNPDWSQDTLTLAGEAPPGPRCQPLLETVMRHGVRTGGGQRSLAESAQHFEQQWAELPRQVKHLTAPAPHPMVVSSRLRQLADEIDAARRAAGEAYGGT